MRTLILGLGLCLLFSSCSRDKWEKEDTLIVGTNAMYYPYESIDKEGKLEGFDIDVAREIGKKLGKKVVFRNISFDALILSLKKWQIDLIISGMSITSTRLKEIAMVPYQGDPIKHLYLVFWNEIPEGTNSMADLKNEIVSVQVGTFQENFLMSQEGVKIRSFENTAELIMDIKYDKSRATLLEHRIANSMKERFPQLKLLKVPLDEKYWVLGNGIGVKKENIELIEKIERAVEELKQDGTIKHLEQKWFP